MTTTTPHSSGRVAGVLARHYVEMVVAMAFGMLVFGAVRGAVGLTVGFDQRPGVSFMLMATDMALAMAAWMRFRGHSWAMTHEMCAAMYAPVVLLPWVRSDLIDPMAFMVAAHVLMLGAMLGVLVLRRHELVRSCSRRAGE